MAADSLAEIVPTGTAVGRPTATARRLVNASLSDNSRRAYAGALGQLDAWLAGQKLDDAALAAYLAELHDHRPRRLVGRDCGRGGALPGPPRRLGGPVRRADRAGSRRRPQNGRRPRPGH